MLLNNLKTNLFFLLRKETYSKTLYRASRYKLNFTKDKIYDFQKNSFNEIWQDAYKNVPFYKEWKETYNLPDKIKCLDELKTWPIVSKKDIQLNQSKFLRKNIQPKGFLKTGGSTGEPLHMPYWENNHNTESMWIGRSAYNFKPYDKTFLIWGHEHLYGKGLNRQINIFIRKIKDYLSNMKRVSAYNLSKESMEYAFSNFIKFCPNIVIGYSPSILAFCRTNKLKRIKKSPRLIICTAGPLTESEKYEIEEFFGAPICMEYGSVECGVMAYTEPTSKKYFTFWDTHLIQALKDEHNEYKNIVTKLTNSYAPLIRYDIGDYLDLSKNEDLNSILNINFVKGRPSDMIKLSDNILFSAILIGDCTKQIDSILANQLHVYKDYIVVKVIAKKTLNDTKINLLIKKFNTVVRELNHSNVKIEQVDKLDETVSGKCPLVIKH